MSFGCRRAGAGTGFQLDLELDGTVKTGSRGQRLRGDQGPWSWALSHVFGNTVAARLDEACFTPRQVADQLGHANLSMTPDVYFARIHGQPDPATDAAWRTAFRGTRDIGSARTQRASRFF